MKLVELVTVMFALYPYVKEVVSTTEEIDNIIKAGKSADIPNEVIISTIEEHLKHDKKLESPQILTEWKNIEDVRVGEESKPSIKKTIATELLDTGYTLSSKVDTFRQNNRALFTAIISLLIEVRLYFLRKKQ